VIRRVTPCEAIRAICAGLSVGNMSGASGALVSGAGISGFPATLASSFAAIVNIDVGSLLPRRHGRADTYPSGPGMDPRCDVCRACDAMADWRVLSRNGEGAGLPGGE
jgi:hypothetical protein